MKPELQKVLIQQKELLVVVGNSMNRENPGSLTSMLRLVIFVLLTALSSQSFARSLDFNISSESAAINYATLVGATNYGRTEFGIGFLYNEDDNYLADLSLLVIDEAGSKSPGLEAGIGLKFYYGQAGSSDVDISGIGLGGQLRYRHPSAPRIVYSGALFYAPGIVTFQDADQIFDALATLEFEVNPSANIYVGYRYITTELKNGPDVDIDNNFILGMRFKF